jgi:hypothetical protein
VRAVGVFLGLRLVLALVRSLRVRAALVALVGQDDQAGRLSARTPQIHSAFLAWTEPGSGPDTHRTSPLGLAMTCKFMPYFLCLPERKGRPAATRSMGASFTRGFLVLSGGAPPCNQTMTNPSQARRNWLIHRRSGQGLPGLGMAGNNDDRRRHAAAHGRLYLPRSATTILPVPARRSDLDPSHGRGGGHAWGDTAVRWDTLGTRQRHCPDKARTVT